MAFHTLLPPTSGPRPRPFQSWSGKPGLDILWNVQFSLSTWLLIGALLQSLLVLVAPTGYALLPAALLLGLRLIDTTLITLGWKRNPYLADSVQKYFSAQVPDREGEFSEEPANETVAVLLLGIRINHPLGLFAPGLDVIGKHFDNMTVNLEKGADENGFLGQSYFLRRDSPCPELNSISYWRTIDDIHAFAHGPVHREGWKWWNKTSKKYPHLGLHHEIYCADKGQWESIYVNFQPTGLAATTYMKKNGKFQGGVVADEWISPIVDASRGNLRTSRGRLGQGHGTENEKYGPRGI